MTECKRLNEVWEFFRTEIRNKWGNEWSTKEMLYGPNERSANKMKTEYVFLRVMNRFTGVRLEGNFDSDVVTPMKKMCEEIINTMGDVFDDKLKIRNDGDNYVNRKFLNKT